MGTKDLRVTTLDEIREQVAPDIIEIPGFKPGTTINVQVRPVDLTPDIVASGLSNPLVAVAVNRIKDGKSPQAVEKEMQEKLAGGKVDYNDLMPIIDAIVKEALVTPNFDEINEIKPLTLYQKIAIMEHAMGDVTGLVSFRGK